MNPETITDFCPLCGGKTPQRFFKDNTREYLRCGSCRLVFVPEKFFLSPEAEKAEYDLHENNVHDPGYQRFLSRLTIPLLGRTGQNREGLDFGCGSGLALSMMMESEGHKMALFDPFYHNRSEVLERSYDFITATEVVEHLHHPGREFIRLFQMLKPGGWLGLMTKLVTDVNAFGRWHYIRDLTHVSFFCRDTFKYLAHHFRADLYFAGNDVILMQKSAEAE